MYTEEKRKSVLDTFYTKANRNVNECAQLTGVNRHTIQRWQQDYESKKKQERPNIPEIRERILIRISELIKTCTDPKKLMDIYAAIGRQEHELKKTHVSLFDRIAEELAKK